MQLGENDAVEEKDTEGESVPGREDEAAVGQSVHGSLHCQEGPTVQQLAQLAVELHEPVRTLEANSRPVDKHSGYLY